MVTLQENFGSLQYSPTIPLTGAIWGTSSEKILQEIVLETLKLRR